MPKNVIFAICDFATCSKIDKYFEFWPGRRAQIVSMTQVNTLISIPKCSLYTHFPRTYSKKCDFRYLVTSWWYKTWLYNEKWVVQKSVIIIPMKLGGFTRDNSSYTGCIKKRKPKSNGLLCKSYGADSYFHSNIVKSNFLLFNWNDLRIDLITVDSTASF